MQVSSPAGHEVSATISQLSSRLPPQPLSPTTPTPAARRAPPSQMLPTRSSPPPRPRRHRQPGRHRPLQARRRTIRWDRHPCPHQTRARPHENQHSDRPIRCSAHAQAGKHGHQQDHRPGDLDLAEVSHADPENRRLPRPPPRRRRLRLQRKWIDKLWRHKFFPPLHVIGDRRRAISSRIDRQSSLLRLLRLRGSPSRQTFSFSMRRIASSTFSRELNALMRK